MLKMLFTSVLVLSAGLALGACSLLGIDLKKDQSIEVQTESSPSPVSASASPMMYQSDSSEPVVEQSTSTEVKDLEADLGNLKLEAETYQ